MILDLLGDLVTSMVAGLAVYGALTGHPSLAAACAAGAFLAWLRRERT